MSTVIDGTTGVTIPTGVFGDASGNVGIGTSSPNARLDIAKASGATDIRLSVGGTLYANIYASSSDTNIFSVAANPLILGTSNTERMRIDSSGNLLVGYTSSNGAYKLQVNSQIFATSATIATSDGRYKKDIQSLDGALGLVNQLNPVQFSWKQHPVHAFDTSTPTIGFIAQEIQQVLADKPYLSSIIKSNKCVIKPEEKDDDGNMIKEAVTEEFLGIAEGNMIALLTKAIQEQQALIQTLTARITALEAR